MRIPHALHFQKPSLFNNLSAMRLIILKLKQRIITAKQRRAENINVSIRWSE